MIYRITVRGLVQGVGFRPMVYRIAKEMEIDGTVENCNDGVIISVDTTHAKMRELMRRVAEEAPPIAEITMLQCQKIESSSRHPWNDFTILPSSLSDGFTQVSPDIAVCADCLHDIEHQKHRIGYPFVNCTHCGPRFTIIKELPYDRSATTMAPFIMCADCRAEYESPANRRFHAQPTGCNHCGVHYMLGDEEDYQVILEEMVSRLERGDIVALKSMGGYNLLCDALNDNSIRRLRLLKNRPRKPFAVMMPSLDVVRDLMKISDKEASLLQSWRRPIVIISDAEQALTENLAPGYHTIGVMLPYMVIHYDIFKRSWLRALVVTSGNDERTPIVIDDNEAHKLFEDKMSLFTVSYNREIENRIDDSVVQVTAEREQVLRRARGYVPQPLPMSLDVDGILAMGADMISAFMIGKHQSAIGSQYIGALDEIENENFFDQSLEHFYKLFSFAPSLIAIDAHPQYVSSRKGKEIAERADVPLLKVWHHHAHACAVMAEHGIQGEVMALVLDGTGYGVDESIWGGEILRCDANGFTRLWHLPSLPLPGGDMATREPWRMAVSLIMNQYGNIDLLPKHLVEAIDPERIRIVVQMIKNDVNAPKSTGAGRLWDAVAALLGVAYHNTYEGEAPKLLEQYSTTGVRTSYGSRLEDYGDILSHILSDMNSHLDTGIIAARFHNTVADALAQKVLELGTVAGLKRVVLSGGVMHNRRLVERLVERLHDDGMTVYMPERYPAGDGGIALGQLYIAANYRLTHRSNFFHHA